jgi:hypothetical protein
VDGLDFDWCGPAFGWFHGDPFRRRKRCSYWLRLRVSL